jgi:hypothetical protein
MLFHPAQERFVQRPAHRLSGFLSGLRLQGVRRFQEDLPGGSLRPSRGFPDHLSPRHQVHPHVLPRVGLLRQVPPPGAEPVHPGRDRVQGPSRGADGEASGPPIVAGLPEGDLAPGGVPFVPIPEDGRDLVVAVGEDVRGDGHPFADGPLDGKAAFVDFRGHVLDDHAPEEVGNAGVALGSLVVGHKRLLPEIRYKTGFTYAIRILLAALQIRGAVPGRGTGRPDSGRLRGGLEYS